VEKGESKTTTFLNSTATLSCKKLRVQLYNSTFILVTIICLMLGSICFIKFCLLI